MPPPDALPRPLVPRPPRSARAPPRREPHAVPVRPQRDQVAAHVETQRQARCSSSLPTGPGCRRVRLPADFLLPPRLPACAAVASRCRDEAQLDLRSASASADRNRPPPLPTRAPAVRVRAARHQTTYRARRRNHPPRPPPTAARARLQRCDHRPARLRTAECSLPPGRPRPPGRHVHDALTANSTTTPARSCSGYGPATSHARASACRTQLSVPRRPRADVARRRRAAGDAP